MATKIIAIATSSRVSAPASLGSARASRARSEPTRNWSSWNSGMQTSGQIRPVTIRTSRALGRAPGSRGTAGTRLRGR